MCHQPKVFSIDKSPLKLSLKKKKSTLVDLYNKTHRESILSETWETKQGAILDLDILHPQKF